MIEDVVRNPEVQAGFAAIALGAFSLFSATISRKLRQLRERQEVQATRVEEAVAEAERSTDATAEGGMVLRQDLAAIGDHLSTVAEALTSQTDKILDWQRTHVEEHSREAQRIDEKIDRVDRHVDMLRHEFQVASEREAREHEILHERIRKVKTAIDEERRGKHRQD